MSATLPVATACCTTCNDQVSVSVPGPAGAGGAAGAAGADGANAFSILQNPIVTPGELANVNVDTDDGMAWATVGQLVALGNAGIYQVISVGSPATLENLKDTGTSAYLTNFGIGIPIAAGATITPAGPQGPTGTAAAGAPDAANSYVLRTAVVGTALPNAQVLDGLATGVVKWNTTTNLFSTGLVSLTTEVTGTLPIANGGTGQTTANPAFNALSPVTTRGDLIYRDATVNARLPIGAANTVLRTNGTDPSWGKVVLTSDVSGVLPAANGGSGMAGLTYITTVGPHTLLSSTRNVQINTSIPGTQTYYLPSPAVGGFYFIHVHTGSDDAVIDANTIGLGKIIDVDASAINTKTINASQYFGLVSDGATKWYIVFLN